MIFIAPLAHLSNYIISYDLAYLIKSSQLGVDSKVKMQKRIKNWSKILFFRVKS